MSRATVGTMEFFIATATETCVRADDTRIMSSVASTHGRAQHMYARGVSPAVTPPDDEIAAAVVALDGYGGREDRARAILDALGVFVWRDNCIVVERVMDIVDRSGDVERT